VSDQRGILGKGERGTLVRSFARPNGKSRERRREED
jgi:hypothetical protein